MEEFFVLSSCTKGLSFSMCMWLRTWVLLFWTHQEKDNWILKPRHIWSYCSQNGRNWRLKQGVKQHNGWDSSMWSWGLSEVMIVTGSRVKPSTFIIIAVTNKRCVRNEVVGHIFLYLPFWDILSCHRMQQCKGVWKLRQAENKEDTRVGQRRQQWPNRSCLALLSSGSVEHSGRYLGQRLPWKLLILKPPYRICCWQKSPALQTQPEKWNNLELNRTCQQAQKEILAFLYSLEVSRSLNLVKISPSIICVRNMILNIGLGYCVINQGHTTLLDRQIASRRSHHGVSLKNWWPLLFLWSVAYQGQRVKPFINKFTGGTGIMTEIPVIKISKAE